MKKVIITAKVHEYMIERLSRQGYSVNHLPQITYEDLYKEIEDAEVYRPHRRIGAGTIQTDAAGNAAKVRVSAQYHGNDGRKSGSAQRLRRELRQLPWRQLR